MNADQRREYQREWHLKNRDRIKARKRAWYIKNRDKMKVDAYNRLEGKNKCAKESQGRT